MGITGRFQWTPVEPPGTCHGYRSCGKDRSAAPKVAVRLPHPFPARDRAAGYRYDLPILQAEFSLTQVLDQPVTGRIFFEEVIREKSGHRSAEPGEPDLRPQDQPLHPGRFRTRVITDGVVPSLHIDYKKSRIKQYPQAAGGAPARPSVPVEQPEAPIRITP